MKFGLPGLLIEILPDSGAASALQLGNHKYSGIMGHQNTCYSGADDNQAIYC